MYVIVSELEERKIDGRKGGTLPNKKHCEKGILLKTIVHITS